MKFDKFQAIVEFNRRNQDSIAAKVSDFYFKMGMNYEKDLLNIMMIVRPLFLKKKYLVLEMPFKDKEIGAICYKRDSYGYTILNSKLSKVSGNFALAHEIFHVFYQEKLPGKRVELYMNEHYLEYEEEMQANLFAGILLMPTPSYVEMFKKFKNEQSEEDSYITVFCKLMSYFEVPYMAAVIRAYELELLPDGMFLETLLKMQMPDVEQEFSRLWLDDSILHHTGRDDYNRLKNLIKETGKKYTEEEILSNDTVDKVLENISKLYDEIRG